MAVQGVGSKVKGLGVDFLLALPGCRYQDGSRKNER